jgi:hypothetical protein
MNNTLRREVTAIQNPALGAVLIWRCAAGYEHGNNIAGALPLPLVFVALPILFHQQTAELLIATQERSGLSTFVEKFQRSSELKTDILLALSHRTVTMKTLSAQSLQMALGRRLVGLDVAAAGIFPLTTTFPVAGVPASIRPLLTGAAKLGNWFSKVSLYEASLLLQVSF